MPGVVIQNTSPKERLDAAMVEIDNLMTLAEKTSDRDIAVQLATIAFKLTLRINHMYYAAIVPKEDLGLATVWHEGSKSFYNARLLRKMDAEEVNREIPQ
jgi:hypothetical protein